VTNITPPPPPGEKKKAEQEPKILVCLNCSFGIELVPGEPRPEKCPSCEMDLPKAEAPPPDVTKYTAEAGYVDPLYEAPPKPAEWLDVTSISYQHYHPPGKERATLMVTYYTEFEHFKEWVCFEHEEGSFPRRNAEKWWTRRTGGMPTPATVVEAKEITSGILEPKRIKVKQDGKYWRIIDYADYA
jgi:hypothetical protein